MWLYPLPCAVALVGWLFVYASTGRLFILIGAGTLLLGAVGVPRLVEPPRRLAVRQKRSVAVD